METEKLNFKEQQIKKLLDEGYTKTQICEMLQKDLDDENEFKEQEEKYYNKCFLRQTELD